MLLLVLWGVVRALRLEGIHHSWHASPLHMRSDLGLRKNRLSWTGVLWEIHLLR